jgi:hypothetical protein
MGIALGAIYLGSAEVRIERLAADQTDMRSDVKEILRKVDDVRMHMAAMDRRSGITEEAVAVRRPR